MESLVKRSLPCSVLFCRQHSACFGLLLSMDAKLHLNITVIVSHNAPNSSETVDCSILVKDAHVLLWYQSQEPNRLCSLTDLVVYQYIHQCCSGDIILPSLILYGSYRLHLWRFRLLIYHRTRRIRDVSILLWQTHSSVILMFLSELLLWLNQLELLIWRKYNQVVKNSKKSTKKPSKNIPELAHVM